MSFQEWLSEYQSFDFDRFFAGAQGAHGLGLALVRHVCAACGWTATAGNDAAGHGEVSIDFAASLRHD